MFLPCIWSIFNKLESLFLYLLDMLGINYRVDKELSFLRKPGKLFADPYIQVSFLPVNLSSATRLLEYTSSDD